MRRTLGGLIAFLVLTATFLVLPVYAAPSPTAEAVPPSIAEVDLGSVDEPADEAVVAIDAQVVAAGEDADVAVGSAVPAPTEDASSTADPADGGVATTGAEAAGVPALTVSQPATTTFSAVGVTWEHDPGVTGVTVHVRVQDVDGTWGEWTSLEQDDVEQTPGQGPDAPALRDGTAPYFTGPASGVQVVVQAADGAAPRDVRTQLIDPGTSAADTHLGAPQVQEQAHAAMAMPTIYSRAQWGADESIRTWDPEFSSTVKAATVHHTADSNDYTADEVPGILRSIYAYHTISRGWGDIGYNVLVDKFGRAWEGRYSGARGIGSPVIGAHAGGFNSFTFGVSMIGNYDTAPTTPAMVSTVAAVIAWKLSLYGVDPAGTTQLTSSGGGTARYSAGTTVTLPTVFGHRDVGSTSCPGQYGYAQLGTIRAQAKNLWITAREPSGSLDVATGGERSITVGGWAYDPDQPTAPVTVHVYVDGVSQVATTADGDRPDIAAAFPGAGREHGYRTTITASPGTHTVCTYAINLGLGAGNPQLGCRTVGVSGPTPEPRGSLDAANVLGSTVYFGGWAFDDDAATTSIPVHVYVDGVGARALTADRQRPDIGAAFPQAGDRHGFQGSVPLSVGNHVVCFHAINQGPGSNTALGCRAVSVASRYSDPLASFDAAVVTQRTVQLSGWAVDPDSPTAPAEVHVYVDGIGRAAVTADGARPDVAGLWPGVGSAHGWSAALVLAAGEHTVCTYGINAGPGANTQIGCRTVSVSAAAYDPFGTLDSALVTGRSVKLDGWAVDPDTPAAPVTVHIYVDGRSVQAVTAERSRPDLIGVLPGAGAAHGWSTTLDLAPGAHQVCAFAINIGTGTQNPLLRCITATVAAAAWNPVGSLDSASRTGTQLTVSGWMADPDGPAAAQVVHVYVDGSPVVALTTGETRSDVAAALGWPGQATGYRGTVTVSSGSHQVCTYAINSGAGSTNPLLGCRTVS